MPYELVYFDIRGLAETARVMFTVAKQEFTDTRYSFAFGTPGDFSTIIRPEFDAAKAAGTLDASGGKVPYLEVDGKKIGQSKAIERYLAKQLGLNGSSDIEGAQIESVSEFIADFKNAYQKVRGIEDADKKKAGMEKWFGEDLPANMKLLETAVSGMGGQPGPWLIGSKVSYADISLYQFIAAPHGFFDDAEGAKASFQDCPKIKAAMEAVGSMEHLQEYFKNRKETMF